MKILVIHPADPTTDFLKVIYDDANLYQVITHSTTKSFLKKSMIDADWIIMLGHGSQYGLFGYNRLLIDSSYVYLLRSKVCIGVWCNADKFFKKYGLNGFYTGMIVSEYHEALDYAVLATGNMIEKSNSLLAESLQMGLKTKDIQKMREVVKSQYNDDDNMVINFNKQNIYIKTA
jgi:hypothetical protein